MNFTSLPPELQDPIVSCLDRGTLRSLCLTSKSLLQLARIHLYRSVALYVDAHPLTTQIGSTDVEEEKNTWRVFIHHNAQSVKLSRQLKSHPELRQLVKELKIEISDTGNTRSGVYEVLSVSSSLLRLELQWKPVPSIFTLPGRQTEEWLDQQTAECLVQATGSSLRYLDLGDAGLSQKTILAILSETPQLEVFAYDVDDRTSPISSVDKFPFLRNLRRLQLGGRALQPSAFLALTSSTTLTSLDVDFMSVPDIPSTAVSTLRALRIIGGGFDPLGLKTTPRSPFT